MRRVRSGGGVSLLVHDKLMIKNQLKTPFDENCESICAELQLKGKHFVVAGIYHPPNSNDNSFIDSLDRVKMSCRFVSRSLTMVLGDFNYDLLKVYQHNLTRTFLSKMLDNDFVPYIMKPRRVTYSSGTLIDNVFVNSKTILPNQSYVILDGMSDHYPCLLSYALTREN